MIKLIMTILILADDIISSNNIHFASHFSTVQINNNIHVYLLSHDANFSFSHPLFLCVLKYGSKLITDQTRNIPYVNMLCDVWVWLQVHNILSKRWTAVHGP